MRRSLLIFLIFFICTSRSTSQELPFPLLGGKNKVVIPITYSNGFIYTELRINKLPPLRFIIDTGAEHTILFDKIYMDLLGLSPDTPIKIVGSDLSKTLEGLIYRNIGLEFKNTPPNPTDIVVLDQMNINFKDIIGEEIYGIIGMSFFKHMIVQVDYKRKKLIIKHPNQIDIPKGFSEIECLYFRNKPHILLTANDSSRVMLVDTGANVGSILYYKDQNTIPTSIPAGNIGNGLGGSLKGYVGFLENQKISEIEIGKLLCLYQKQDSLFQKIQKQFKRHGALGNRFLNQFDWIFDFHREKVYLRKNEKFKFEPQYNMSGMDIHVFGGALNQFFISSINEGSPADKVGLKRGDIIKNINGLPYLFLHINKIYNIISKKEGKRIKVIVERKGVRIKKRFKLDRYLEERLNS